MKSKRELNSESPRDFELALAAACYTHETRKAERCSLVEERNEDKLRCVSFFRKSYGGELGINVQSRCWPYAPPCSYTVVWRSSHTVIFPVVQILGLHVVPVYVFRLG